jgi:hypothetical protein
MGTRGREIVGVNTEKVLSLLNKAFADIRIHCHGHPLNLGLVRHCQAIAKTRRINIINPISSSDTINNTSR